MIVKINGELMKDVVFCSKHNQWYYVDDEMNCCARELEYSK